VVVDQSKIDWADQDITVASERRRSIGVGGSGVQEQRSFGEFERGE
jgi:hypothetical protein